jgi:hypothetical protein
MFFSLSELAGNEVDCLLGNATWCRRDSDTSAVVGLVGDHWLRPCGYESERCGNGSEAVSNAGKVACSPIQMDTVGMMLRGIQ